MKKWHIAALVIVGLIVAGIAYTMYEKRKVGMVRRVRNGGKAQLKTEGTPGANSGVPGLGNKVEPERPAAVVVGPHTGYEYEAYKPDQEYPEWW